MPTTPAKKQQRPMGHGRGGAQSRGSDAQRRSRPSRGGEGGEQGGRDRNRRTPRREAPRSEFDHKLLAIRRVTRVVAGGRRFNFSVAVVIGNRKGMVGVGLGKAGDTTLAIEKAQRDARKNAVRIPVTNSFSVPHDVSAKYCATIVSIAPAPGRGLVAGSSVRSVLELAGITDVNAKILSRSKNKLNNARAAVKALGAIKQKHHRTEAAGGKKATEAEVTTPTT